MRWILRARPPFLRSCFEIDKRVGYILYLGVTVRRNLHRELSVSAMKFL